MGGLPILYRTSIPVCCLVLKKERNGDSGNIMFIDASKEFIPGKQQNSISDEHINKIVNTYIERKDVEKYAHVAPMDEIIENDYNLNIPRYVDTSEKEPEIDLNEVFGKLENTDNDIKEATENLNEFMRQLGLKELS